MSVRKQEARDLTKLAVFMAFAVFVLTLAMGVGIVVAAAGMWLPHM